MKFQFHLKNGKTHQFTLPDNAEAHRAIMWVSKDEREDEKPRFIIIPDDVESVEIIEDRARPSPPPTLGTASPTIYCVYCGAENQLEDNFCQKCGKKLVKSGGY